MQQGGDESEAKGLAQWLSIVDSSMDAGNERD